MYILYITLPERISIMYPILPSTTEELDHPRAYASPALTLLGHVSDLTAGGSAGDPEGGAGPGPFARF